MSHVLIWKQRQRMVSIINDLQRTESKLRNHSLMIVKCTESNIKCAKRPLKTDILQASLTVPLNLVTLKINRLQRICQGVSNGLMVLTGLNQD